MLINEFHRFSESQHMPKDGEHGWLVSYQARICGLVHFGRFALSESAAAMLCQEFIDAQTDSIRTEKTQLGLTKLQLTPITARGDLLEFNPHDAHAEKIWF